MKNNIFKSLFLGLALVLATGAFAASTNKGSMQLMDSVTSQRQTVGRRHLPSEVGRHWP